MKKNNYVHYVIIIFILIFLFLPLLATFLYSIATQWDTTVLPKGFTFVWYKKLFSDMRFLKALERSLIVSSLTLIISLLVLIPAIFIITVYFPKLEKVLKTFTIIPFAIPGVISAVGLIKLYSNGPLPIAGTIWILLGAYFIVSLPFMYQSIYNGLKGMNANILIDAANLLGANGVKAFFYVILPNMKKGIIVSALLSFSILFGEFVLANILAGGNYETVQVYLFSKRGESGHFTSAIVISYFIIILILSGIIVKYSKSINNSKE